MVGHLFADGSCGLVSMEGQREATQAINYTEFIVQRE